MLNLWKQNESSESSLHAKQTSSKNRNTHALGHASMSKTPHNFCSKTCTLSTLKMNTKAKIPPSSFLAVGNKIMKRDGKSGSKSTERVRFKATFGSSPEVCSLLWDLLQPQIKAMPRNARPSHLLWGLLFLKIHSTESVHASLAGGVDEQTFRDWSWRFVYAIERLAPQIARGVSLFCVQNLFFMLTAKFTAHDNLN